jgi:hypothetical protein
MHIGGIFCDLANAFDCINHEILLDKLHFCEIQGIICNWFRFYLTDRRQKKKINEMNSFNTAEVFFFNLVTVRHGFPRVSPRPLLTSHIHTYIYINYLAPTIITLSEPIIFADDTSVIISSKNFGDFCTRASKILSYISKLFTANTVDPKTR